MADIQSGTWSPVDASNNAASPNGWTSGSMLPSQVEPTARGMMGAIRRWYDRANGTLTSGGSANAQTLTYAVAPAALVSGDAFVFFPGFTNTGNLTLNINGLGAKNVVCGSALLSGGEVVLNKPAQVYYDGVSLQL